MHDGAGPLIGSDAPQALLGFGEYQALAAETGLPAPTSPLDADWSHVVDASITPGVYAEIEGYRRARGIDTLGTAMNCVSRAVRERRGLCFLVWGQR